MNTRADKRTYCVLCEAYVGEDSASGPHGSMIKPQLAGSSPHARERDDWRKGLSESSEEGETERERGGGSGDEKWASAMREVQAGVAADELGGPFARKLSSQPSSPASNSAPRPLIAARVLPAPSNWGSMTEEELRAAVSLTRASTSVPSSADSASKTPVADSPKVQVIESLVFRVPEPSAADIKRIETGLERAEAEEKSERRKQQGSPILPASPSASSVTASSSPTHLPGALLALHASLERECALIERLGANLGRDEGFVAVEAIAEAAARCSKLAGAITALKGVLRSE